VKGKEMTLKTELTQDVLVLPNKDIINQWREAKAEEIVEGLKKDIAEHFNNPLHCGADYNISVTDLPPNIACTVWPIVTSLLARWLKIFNYEIYKNSSNILICP
jgi:hypothetical protein